MLQVTKQKVFKYDGTIRVYAMSFIISLGLSIYLTFFGEEGYPVIGYVFFGVTFVELVLLVIRIFYFKSFNQNVALYKAVVTKAFYYRGTKRIRFVYTIDGKEYTKRNAVIYTKGTRDLSIGDEVDVFVKVKMPNQALIRDFYFDEV